MLGLWFLVNFSKYGGNFGVFVYTPFCVGDFRLIFGNWRYFFQRSAI
jgi:hypothetical protein